VITPKERKKLRRISEKESQLDTTLIVDTIFILQQIRSPDNFERTKKWPLQKDWLYF